MDSSEPCPVCREGVSVHYVDVDGVAYLRCQACRSIHVTTAVLDALDAGRSLLRDYGEDYWRTELVAARNRARGESLCRAGEAVLYCRRPVQRFLDLGTGPGYLLEQLLGLLDPAGEVFHGVELFPPAEHFRHANYHAGSAGGLEMRFDAGCCIEVIEHLTPTMLAALVDALARASEPDSFWLFNTGLDVYVEHEDAAYLDPYRRGHIVAWSIAGLRCIFEPRGFRIAQLPGKSFAFAAEYRPTQDCPYDERIYAPLSANAELLKRHPLLFNATFEAARSYFYYAGYLQRTAWAQSLERELVDARSTAAATNTQVARQRTPRTSQ